jgi:hypothetical protein
MHPTRRNQLPVKLPPVAMPMLGTGWLRTTWLNTAPPYRLEFTNPGD